MRSLRSQMSGILIVATLFLLAGCGNSDSPSPEAKTTITGSVYAAPVAGATVVALNSNGTTTLAGPVITLSDGSYSLPIPTAALASDLIISATSGTFADEATSTDVTAGTLAAYVTGGSLTAGSAVYLDPSSTIVHGLVTCGSGTSVAGAMSMFGAAFGYTPDTSVAPQNPDSPLTDGSDAPRRLAGLRAAAFSRLAFDLGLTPGQQFDLIKAMAKDLSDGLADGLYIGAAIEVVPGINLPTDWKTRLGTALATMANVRLTDSYQITYMPGMGMMAPKTGKSKFQIRIVKRIDNTPATGLALKIKPLMHMVNGVNHSTPVDIVSESTTTPGTYDCTAYYLMASGMSMGFWDLKVDITDGTRTESAMFFPPVGMAMGTTTVRATLKGQASDLISSMTGTEKRSYYLFKDGLVTASTTTFNMFIAAKQRMMSYPAVSIGSVLSSPTGTVTSMTVDASTDGGSSWVAALDNSNGHWSVPGLTGLVSGTTGTIYVKMTVNGEDKTTDGNAVAGANGYATFVVTP